MFPRHVLLLALVGVVSLAACSSDEATPEAMNEAVMAAASAVLDGPFELVATEFTSDGEVLRSEWLDYRSDEQFRQVFGSEIDGRSSALAWIVVDGERFCATSGVGDACAFDVAVDQATWASYGPVGAPSGNTKPILDVLAAEFVQMRLTPTIIERSTLGRSDGPDESSTWTLSVPLAGGLEHWTWTIDAEGVLTELSIRGEGVLALDRFERMEASFTPVDAPEPIVAPVPGSAFQLEELPIPEGTPLLTD